MLDPKTIGYDQDNLLACLEEMDNDALDALDFGVIGFNSDGIICRYNAYEAQAAVLTRERVLGRELFIEIAICMNNYLVAQRFEDARDAVEALDETIDYVLTWKMRPTKVKLRMLSSPEYPTCYIIVLHRL